MVCAPDSGGITRPPGSCAAVVADQVGLARHMALSPNGSLYVALADSRDGSVRGGVLALRDDNGDGRADRKALFADRGGNGIAYGLGHLPFAQNDRILRYVLPPWRFLPVGEPASVVAGLPADGDHVNKTVVLRDPPHDRPFVPFDESGPAGDYEVFADGFAGDGQPLPEAALHRPVGLAQGPDGSLYISGDKGGRIWRVIFRGR